MQAAVPAAPATPRVDLRYDLWIDVPVTVGLAAGELVWLAVRNDALPARCVLCEGERPGEVNAVDDWFRTALKRPDPKPARVVSDVVGFGVAPAAAVGLGALVAAADDRLDEAPTNTLLLAETLMVTLVLDDVLKSTLRRERPYAHALDPDAKTTTIEDSRDAILSFPSGHTSTAFALAAAGGTLATMRGYRFAPLVWITGAFLGVATGYARIAADQHYFTDVVSGAAIGTLTGIAVPRLFHSPREKFRPVVGSTAVPGGRVVTVGVSF